MTERHSMTRLGTIRGAGRAAREDADRPAPRWPVVILRVAGSGLLIAAAAIHLDLYLTGYRTVPTIGWLFLLQVITAFALAAVIAATGWGLGAAARAGFALATLGGYLLSLWVGLFGFTEVRSTSGIVAGIIDIAAFATLAVAAAPGLPYVQRLGRLLLPLIGAASAVALALLIAAAATPRSQPQATASGPDVLQARTVGGVTLLTNAQGLTLYTFAPDSAGKSACYGSCASYWPPVTGSPTAGPGVQGRLGTITRTDGSRQATYGGRPLYTYIGDRAPGQDTGNNINL